MNTVHISTPYVPKTHINLTPVNKPNTFRSFRSKSWKAAGSIADVVIWIFHWLNPSGRILNLASAQLLTETNTRTIPFWAKAGQYVELINLPLSCVNSLEFWKLQPPGALGKYPDLYTCSSTSTLVYLITLVCGTIPPSDTKSSYGMSSCLSLSSCLLSLMIQSFICCNEAT